MEIQFLAWDWYKHASGSKLKNGITTLCVLDNWIYNDNTDINKQKCLLSTKDQVKKKNKDCLTWSQYNVSDFRHGFCGLLFL